MLNTANRPHVLSVHLGKVAPLGPENVPSGFVKQAVQGPVTVTPVGLVGDEQADLNVHGGPDKAVYGYGAANYVGWREDYPQHSHLFVPGGVGENLERPPAFEIRGFDIQEVRIDSVRVRG